MPNDIMTPREVAAYLRIGYEKALDLLKAEVVPGQQLGGTWRCSRQRLDEWMQGKPLEKMAAVRSQLARDRHVSRRRLPPLTKKTI